MTFSIILLNGLRELSFPFLKIGLIHPIFIFSGKYPSLIQRLIMCVKTGEIIYLHASITDVEMVYSPLPLFFKSLIAFKFSD